MDFRSFDFKNKEYYIYDEELVYQKVLSENTNKDTLLEEYNNKKRQLMAANVLQKLLNAKIGFEYDIDLYTEQILKLMDSLPFEIYPNIVEWINEEEITDIKIKDISLKELAEYIDLKTCESKKQYDYFFYILLEILGHYCEGEYQNKDQIINVAWGRTYYM